MLGRYITLPFRKLFCINLIALPTPVLTLLMGVGPLLRWDMIGIADGDY